MRQAARMATQASGEVVQTSGNQAAGEEPVYPLARVFRESFLGKFAYLDHQETLRGFDKLLASLVVEGYDAIDDEARLDLGWDVTNLVRELEQVVSGLAQVHLDLDDGSLNAAESRLALAAGDAAGKIEALVKELNAAVERYQAEGAAERTRA